MLAGIKEAIIFPSLELAMAYAKMLIDDLKAMGYNVEETERDGKKAYIIEKKVTILVW